MVFVENLFLKIKYKILNAFFYGTIFLGHFCLLSSNPMQLDSKHPFFNFSFNSNQNNLSSSNPSLTIPNSNTVCLNSDFTFAVVPNIYLQYILVSSMGTTLQTSITNTFNIPITSTSQSDTYSVYVIGATAQFILSFDIYVLPPFDFSNALIVSPNYSVCIGKTVNVQPTNNSPYFLTSSNLNFYTNYTVTVPIPFTVVATYTNEYGYNCAYSKSYTIFPTVPLNTSVSQNGYTLTSMETSSYVSYQWKDCNIIVDIPGATQQTFSPIQPGFFYVKLTSPYCTDSSDCISVNPNSPYVNITSSNVTCIDKQNGSIRIDFISPYPYYLYKTKWNPDFCNKDTCLFISGLSAGIYTIEFEFKHEFNSSLDVKLTYTVAIEDNSQPCILKPYNSVAIGNNSGYFHIDGISDYADNEVLIFSRWGNKIAYIKNYNNNDKKWPDKNTSVIPGTYYYIINIDNKSKPIKGWLEVIE